MPADAVATQTLMDDDIYVVQKFTNISDGTGESSIAKIDVSALSPACYAVTIEEIWYTTSGMDVDLYWDADTDAFIMSLTENTADYLDFRIAGGLTNTFATGYTGDILFTTRNHTSSDTYSIILKCKKLLRR